MVPIPSVQSVSLNDPDASASHAYWQYSCQTAALQCHFGLAIEWVRLATLYLSRNEPSMRPQHDFRIRVKQNVRNCRVIPTPYVIPYENPFCMLGQSNPIALLGKSCRYNLIKILF